MKTKCKQVQAMIFSKRHDELNIEEKQTFDEHVSSCVECKEAFETIHKSEVFFNKFKSYQPKLNNENTMVDFIMKKINESSIDIKFEYNNSFFGRLINVVSQKSVRFALASVLFLFISVYLFEEYSAVKKITHLETQLKETGELTSTKAGIISFDNGFIKFFYDIYSFARGNSSYMKLSEDLLLINKEDLRKLLLDYDKLDNATKERIKSIQKELLNEKEINFNEIDEVKIKTLQDEIERLNKELQKIKTRGGK